MPNQIRTMEARPVELTPRKQADDIMRLAREVRENNIGYDKDAALTKIRRLAGKLRRLFSRG